MAIKTVLFDIDGTILNCNRAGKISLIEATREVFGTTGRMERVDFQGKTDPLILKESLESMGISQQDIEDKTDTLKDKYFAHLEKNIHNFEVYIYPGIMEILSILSERDDIILGLLTGNFTESAKIKLSRHDLNRFFPFGAFGDDAPIRDLLPDVAKKKISDMYGVDVDFSSTYIIGDTVYDVRCAKYAGAVSIAVATGWSDMETLQKENPDYCFDNLSDINKFLTILED